MKKTILLLAILFHFTANAQLTSGLLDSLSVDTYSLEKLVEGLTYKDATGQEYQLSFPAEPFTIWSYNKLASKAVYKKQGDKEVLHLTENIDFTKATGISVSDDYKGVTYIQVDFPKGSLKTQLFENGKTIGTINADYLEFFCPSKTLNEDKEFLFDKQFERMYLIAANLLVDKKLFTVEAATQELADWYEDYANFAAKHPKSLFQAQIARNKAEKEKLIPQIEYIKTLMEKYGFQTGLSAEAFKSYNPQAAPVFRKKEYNQNGRTSYFSTNAFGNPFPAGPFTLTIDNDSGHVTYFSTIILTGKNLEADNGLEELLKEIRDIVAPQYITEKYGDLIIDVPGAPVKVTLDIMEYNKWRSMAINFSKN